MCSREVPLSLGESGGRPGTERAKIVTGGWNQTGSAELFCQTTRRLPLPPFAGDVVFSLPKEKGCPETGGPFRLCA
jgi:hypothetical protein